MTYPSMKTLTQNFGEHKARYIRDLMEGTFDPEKLTSVSDWVTQCYSSPSILELQLSGINDILEGHGVEAIWGEAETMLPAAEYINMGDTYDSTILYDHTRAKWEVTTWGDWVEWAEKNKIIKREE